MTRLGDDLYDASSPIALYERPGVTSPGKDGLPFGGSMNGVDIRGLEAGTSLIVDTRNSRYRLVMCGGSPWRNAFVQGGRLFPEETEARIEGLTLGGSSLSVGWIGVGWLLEMTVSGERIVTSRVRSIWIDDSRPSRSSSVDEMSSSSER